MLFTVLCSCVAPTQSEVLSRYLRTHLGLADEQFPTAIVVVSEDGCVHCDRAFADLVRPRASEQGLLFIVRIEGSAVDMHGFMEQNEQMHFDDDRSFKQLGILPGSGLILLDGGRINTVIPVQLDGIEGRLNNIERILDSVTVARYPP